MNFFVILTFLSAVNAVPVAKRGEQSFGLVSIHSGSELQYAPITEDENRLDALSVGGSGSKFTLKSGTLYDEAGRALGVYSESKDVGVTERGASSFGISEKSGLKHLTFDGHEAFVACPYDQGYTLTFNSTCKGGLGIGLLVV